MREKERGKERGDPDTKEVYPPHQQRQPPVWDENILEPPVYTYHSQPALSCVMLGKLPTNRFYQQCYISC